MAKLSCVSEINQTKSNQIELNYIRLSTSQKNEKKRNKDEPTACTHSAVRHFYVATKLQDVNMR